MKAKFLLSFVLLMIIFTSQTLAAQDIVRVKGEYTLMAPETMSIAEARNTAIERAKIQAIENEFGSIVSQASSTTIKTNNAENEISQLSFGSTEVKGEWLETIDVQVTDPIFENNMIIITATVVGKAREIVRSAVDLKIKVLRNGTEDKFESSDFREKDDMYVSFASPIDGYVAIYLVDESEQAYCILPYTNQSEGIYKVKGNQPYIFFSADSAPYNERALVDEYVMTAGKERESNILYIIFSPNSFFKANDKFIKESSLHNLSHKDFQEWLAKCRRQDKEMSVTQRIISIAKQ